MKSRTYCRTVIIGLLTCLILVGGGTAWIDPYFHYHKPVEGFSYPLKRLRQRYINDGIIKNFDYDAIIIGSSMTEQFRTSQFDSLFGTKSVKTPFSGATAGEINNNLKKALKENSDVKIVLRCLDNNKLAVDATELRGDVNYPTYLYNDNYFDDVYYLLNKEVLLGDVSTVLSYTVKNRESDSFDSYSNWGQIETGKKAVLSSYKRPDKVFEEAILTEDEKKMEIENISANVIDVIENNPDCIFYLYYPPYSIVYFDTLRQRNELKKQIDIWKIATEMLLKYDNVKLYSWFDEYDMIGNLNNYRDYYHYDINISNQLVQWMREGRGELTPNNYEEHFNKVCEFYNNYDYEKLWE